MIYVGVFFLGFATGAATFLGLLVFGFKRYTRS